MKAGPRQATKHAATLCLACSSSLLPKVQDVFLTPCCSRPICPTCLSTNPRLGRYNPCLSCLGGVGVVGASSLSSSQALSSVPVAEQGVMNVDGALRDDAVFVLGDDGDDDDIDLQQISSRIHAVSRETGLSTAYTSSPEPKLDHLPDSFAITKSEDPVSDRGIDLTTTDEAAPRVYHLRRGDTLQGIALRCGVNGYELCRLNNLPPSTLSTTPHLLHTRTTIKLPPSARPSFGRATPPVDPEADIRRVRGRAEERLQILTKETDWRVAKAYVALADDPEEEVVHAMKCKEMRVGVDGVTLDARAVSMYLDDEEWEEEQRKVGKVFTPSRTTTFRACK